MFPTGNELLHGLALGTDDTQVQENIVIYSYLKFGQVLVVVDVNQVLCS